MRLKEIEQGMDIHCKTEDEAEKLLKYLHEFGYKWFSGMSLLKETNYGEFKESTCYTIMYDKLVVFGHIEDSENAIEFSDLIIPELSAEEVIQICTEICERTQCDECPMGDEHCFTDKDSDKSKIIEICQKWKSDHEKKEPEVEWFWRGKIFSIDDMGKYLQIADDKSVFDTGCECQESAEEYMADELKEYCKTHEGNYIAKVERICRVKAVE